jgi:hypothetical protein
MPRTTLKAQPVILISLSQRFPLSFSPFLSPSPRATLYITCYLHTFVSFLIRLLSLPPSLAACLNYAHIVAPDY